MRSCLITKHAPWRLDHRKRAECRRGLATAQNNLISRMLLMRQRRAGLYQTLASTLQHYGINLPEAAREV